MRLIVALSCLIGFALGDWPPIKIYSSFNVTL